MKKKGLAWHSRHTFLVEYVHNYEDRLAAIKKYESPEELGVRLALFKFLNKRAIQELPKEWREANKNWVKMCEIWKKYRKKISKKRAKLEKVENAMIEVEKKYRPELELLHQKYCACKEWRNGIVNFTKEELKNGH